MEYINAQNAGIFSQLAYAPEGSGVGSLSSEWVERTDLSGQIIDENGVVSQFRAQSRRFDLTCGPSGGPVTGNRLSRLRDRVCTDSTSLVGGRIGQRDKLAARDAM